MHTFAMSIALVLVPLLSGAQIIITDMESVSNHTLRLWFHAESMASTNYSVEFSPDLSPSNGWEHVGASAVINIGNNNYEIAMESATNRAGFYRILSPEELRAWFEDAEINLDEGNQTIVLTIRFNGHYRGTLTYTVEGTGIDSIDGLTGTVEVDGTSATITITLHDNATIDQLRYVSISLQGTSELSLGSPSAATVNILENDAVWQGILETETGTLGFQLQLVDNGATLLGEFGSGGFGFFPSNPLPAQVSLSDQAFAANITNITISADTTLLNTPMELELALFADENLVGGGIQTVDDDYIEGQGTLIIAIPFMPYLNATNQGTFVLQKPPVAPSTNEVELVDIP
jgi:hypothetical protein